MWVLPRSWYDETMANICKICNEEFDGKSTRASFCPKEHYRPCLYCGEDYLVKKVVKPPLYCSGSCSAKARNQNKSHEIHCRLCGDIFFSGNGNAKVCEKKHYKTCLHCKKDFEILNISRVRDFCSQDCGLKGTTYEKTCKRCGSTFTSSSINALYCENDHFSPCITCGKAILLKQPKRITRFCSSSCAAKERVYTNICELCGDKFTSGKSTAYLCSKVHFKDCVVCGASFEVKNKYMVPEACSPVCAATLVDFEARNKKSVATLREKHGVDNAYQIPHVVEKMLASGTPRISKLNLQWKERLANELDLSFATEVLFGGNNYADLGHGNVLIDINPSISHNTTTPFLHLIGRCTRGKCSCKPREELYHHKRFLEAEAAGKTLLQYFDWYDEEIFLSIVRSKLKLDEHRVAARKCEVREITQKEANGFLRENHLLGAARGQTFCVGLFFQEELVHVHTYGPARLNRNYEWEAIRSASKMNWHVQGGYRKCDSHFFRKAAPKSVVSYVDLALSTGATEAANPGWRLLSTNRGGEMWVKIFTGPGPAFIRGASARRLSADRLLGFEVGAKYPSHHPDGRVFTNADVLLAEGYVQMFDAGTRTFAWGSPA